MAFTSFTIRNLTPNPIELKLLERFEAAKSNNGGITKAFTGILSSRTTPSSPLLATKAESFTNEEVSVTIGAFESKTTDIHPNPRPDGKGILRLTFEVEGQRYRLDTPTPSQRSTVLTPLSPDPKFEYTAVHHPKSAHLTLYSSANLSSWMSKLQDATPLSALSIPGTHNSPTHYAALPSVRCQAVSVEEQLNNGVRFLDIRVQPESPKDPSKDGLILVHSAFPISLTGNKYLKDLLSVVYAFLEATPSETVIVSLKREGIGNSTDQQLSKILHTHYTTDPTKWFTDNRLPTLGECRGKFVLIRRFAIDDSLKGENNGKGYAIDAESWPDNCADGTCTSGEIRVQDFYEVVATENIGKKITYSKDQLARAAESTCSLPISNPTPTRSPGEAIEAAKEEASNQPFFMNFLTASNFFSPGCWPDRIAAKVNPVVVDHLCRNHHLDTGKGDGGTGIVVCDWVGLNGDWDLVRCVVGMNAKLIAKGDGKVDVSRD